MVKPVFSVLLLLIINNGGAAGTRKQSDSDLSKVLNGKFVTTIPPPSQGVRTEESRRTTVPEKIAPPTLSARDPKKVPNGKFITTIPPPQQFVGTETSNRITVQTTEAPVATRSHLLSTTLSTEQLKIDVVTEQSSPNSVSSISTHLPSVVQRQGMDPMIPDNLVITTEQDIEIPQVSPVLSDVSESNVIDIKQTVSTDIIHYLSATVEASVSKGLVSDSNFVYLTLPPVIHQTTEAPTVIPVLKPATVTELLGLVPDSNFMFLTLTPAIPQSTKAPVVMPVFQPATASEPLGFVPDSNFMFTTLPPAPLVTAKAATASEIVSLSETIKFDYFIPNDIPKYKTTPEAFINDPTLLNVIEIQAHRASTLRSPLMEALTVASTTRPHSIVDAFDTLGSGNSTQTLSSTSTLVFTTTKVIVSSFKNTENGIAINQMSTLLNQMLSGYNTVIRPRSNQARFVSVNTEFVTLSIIEFDTQEQRFSVMGYFKINWRDDFLTWDPNSYEGTETVRLSTKSIWIPQLKIAKVGLVSLLPNLVLELLMIVFASEYIPLTAQHCFSNVYQAKQPVAWTVKR